MRHAERRTALTDQTRTAELAAAHAATHPYEREDETRPASWRLEGLPGTFTLKDQYVVDDFVPYKDFVSAFM